MGKSEEKVDWAVIEEKSTDTWLELKDPDGWYDAVVKWDGCIHFRRYFNDPMDHPNRKSEDQDYLHICDIDETIKRLQSLKEAALNHFGMWPR